MNAFNNIQVRHMKLSLNNVKSRLPIRLTRDSKDASTTGQYITHNQDIVVVDEDKTYYTLADNKVSVVIVLFFGAIT
jgi:hypothetical protein